VRSIETRTSHTCPFCNLYHCEQQTAYKPCPALLHKAYAVNLVARKAGAHTGIVQLDVGLLEHPLFRDCILATPVPVVAAWLHFGGIVHVRHQRTVFPPHDS
jgi:hypothetical protein